VESGVSKLGTRRWVVVVRNRIKNAEALGIAGKGSEKKTQIHSPPMSTDIAKENQSLFMRCMCDCNNSVAQGVGVGWALSILR